DCQIYSVISPKYFHRITHVACRYRMRILRCGDTEYGNGMEWPSQNNSFPFAESDSVILLPDSLPFHASRACTSPARMAQCVPQRRDPADVRRTALRSTRTGE